MTVDVVRALQRLRPEGYLLGRSTPPPGGGGAAFRGSEILHPSTKSASDGIHRAKLNPWTVTVKNLKKSGSFSAGWAGLGYRMNHQKMMVPEISSGPRQEKRDNPHTRLTGLGAGLVPVSKPNFASKYSFELL